MKPILSIVIPVYKVEMYIHRCVQSVINQTLKDIEIILIDDGSPDNCPKICDDLALAHPYIKVVHKQNAGLGMACNSGIEVSTGKYIAFLDSDDWVETDMYQSMVDAAEKFGAQMVFTGLQRVNERGEKTLMSQAQEMTVISIPENVMALGLDMISSSPKIAAERNIMMSAKVVLYSRQMIEDNHIRFNSERQIISEDLFFNLDCLSHADCVVQLPKTFYNYFINSESLTLSYRHDRFDKTVLMYQALRKRYEAFGNELKTRADRMIIGYSRTILRQLFSNKGLNLKEKRKEFQKIACNPLWKEINHTYPVKLMPKSHRLLFTAVVNSNFILVWLIMSSEKLIRGEVH